MKLQCFLSVKGLELEGEELDIAVDPLEGTNFAAKNLPNAISVMAVAEKGCLLSAPILIWKKLQLEKVFQIKLLILIIQLKKI